MAVQAMGLDLGPLHHGFRVARRRLWWQRGIRALARGLCAALGFALAAALLAAWQAPEALRGGLWVAGALALVTGLVAAVALRPSRSQAARAVDHRLGLRQQLGTAEELLARSVAGSLVELQLASASDLAEDLPISKLFPLLPRREAVLALSLATLTGVVLVAVGMGLILPNPLEAVRFPAFNQEAAAPAEQEVLGIRREADPLKSRSPGLDQTRRMLEEIQRQSKAGMLSPAAAAAALAAANGELNRVADESRTQQEALGNLAAELLGTAAGREAAESLRQGNYEQTANQLRELGRQSDQLSAGAKRELSDALARSALRSQSAQELARSETRASQTLRRNDYSSTVQSMDQLAGAVRNSANRMVPQSELADIWRRLEEMSQQLGGLGLQEEGRGPLSPPVAQVPQGAGERSGSLQQGGAGDPRASEGGPGEGQQAIPGGQAGTGQGEPGTTPGGPAEGSQQNPRLGPDGNPLEVEGRIGDRFPGESESGSETPSVLREGKASSVPSSQDQEASGPISVPAEKVFVPGDRRAIVRDYFSKGSGGQ